jgi:SAM-dependent methyltransferase
MWWFAATHANLLLQYRRSISPASKPAGVLDAGCGTGGLLAQFVTQYPEAEAFGLDADPGACERAAAKSHRPVCAGSVNDMPFADTRFAAIFSADVLCHAGVDERATLGHFRRCLRDDGVVILNLPAYGWMLSRHDHAVANVRRYTRGGVARMLREAGFRLVFASYWNTILFPLMVLTRKLLPSRGEPVSDVHPYPAPIEALCRAATRVETALLGLGWRLPFGGSVIAVAAKVPVGGTHA